MIYNFTLFSQSFERSELPTQVSSPWEIIYGPDNFLWLTESGGKITRVNPETGDKTVIFTASDYFGGSSLEGTSLCSQLHIGSGTLGMALHPDFSISNTSFLYFVYSYNSGTVSAPDTKFRIKRLTWDANSETVINDSNIVNLISNGYDHLGGRLMSIKQNNIPYLFLSIGDHGVSEDSSPQCYSPQSTNPNNFAQDVTTQNGKVHRFNMDGSTPLDNPIAGNSFYTRGHRNPQGLMYNDKLNILYDIEHGDYTDDEINVLQKGMNYGWKNVRGFHSDNSFAGELNYVNNYTPHPQIANDALIEPLYSWCTAGVSSSNYSDWCTVAPSGGVYYGSNSIPEWTNSLLVVTLKEGTITDKELYQFKLADDGSLITSTSEQPNPTKYFGEDQAINGRLRDITISNDGSKIYLINNGGTPADKITVYTNQPITPDELPILLFPNPVKDEISIQGITNGGNLKDLQILSVDGKVYQSSVSTASKIDVSKLSIGTYFVKFSYEDKSHTLKFIKE